MESALAAGCLQAVMSLLYPELAKFAAFQRERVARYDEEHGPPPSRRPRAVDPVDSSQPADVSCHLKFLRQHWHSHLRLLGLPPELPAVVQRALLYRNKVAHQSHMTSEQYATAVDTFQRLAELIECNNVVKEQMKAVVETMLKLGGREEPTQQVQEKQHVEEEEEEEEIWVELKLLGNDFFREKNYEEAIEAYSQGLEAAPHQAVLYGNRAMCHLRRKEFDLAREDAEDAMDEDGGENIKYFRLLSEALMGLREFDEAKEICDQGLQLEPADQTLLARQSKAEALAKEEKVRLEEDKKKREQQERAKLAAANAAAAVAAATGASKPAPEPEKPTKKKHKSKSKGRLKKSSPELELAPMINYQEVSPKLIEVHRLGSRQLEMYRQGMKFMVMAAETLLDVTDSIGEPGRGKLPLEQMVREGIANLHKAGEAGVAEAWFRLGVLYSSTLRKGIPITPDPHKKVEYFFKAAACRPFIQPPGTRVFPHQGVAEAENELGVCYRDGRPTSVLDSNPEKAFEFFLRSAKHDFPMGQYNVSVAYTIGFGTTVNAPAARLWASRAAQHGVPEAQQHFADLLERGFGGKRDSNQAREWALAASQSRLTGLMLKPDLSQSPDAIAEIFAAKSSGVKHGKDFWEFCNMYLNEDGFDHVDSDSSADESDDEVLNGLSYAPHPICSSDQLGQKDIFRPVSAVINAEIQVRAKAGSITAHKYLESEKLLTSAASFLAAGDVQSGLRDLKKADLMWERPKQVLTSSLSYPDLLSKALEEASVSLQLNPRDLDAAYIVGRWEVMSDEDIILHWKRCVKMHPSEASFHFYLGTAYLTIRSYEDAQLEMETALAIDRKAEWLYWLASPMVGMGLVDAARSVFEEYVALCAPDERFMPDAYYALGALAFKTFDSTMAIVYHELGQLAESVTIRFPAFYPRVLVNIPKETLRAGMKKNGYMESSVIANITAQTTVECGFCKCSIKPTQLLNHKMYKCPRRSVFCQECGAQMLFDDMQAHQQSSHPRRTKKKQAGKQHTSSASSLQVSASNANSRQENDAEDQQLVAPKFHFVGAILEISRGKNKPTVVTLQTVSGQRWTVRVTVSAVVSTVIEGAAVQNTMLVFWRHSPPLEMIDKRALIVPAANEVYGQDVAMYVLKCSAQTLSFELRELRQNTHVENGTLCSSCNCPPLGGSNLSVCGSCKAVKYCSRECQKIHWKRVHRFMCADAALLACCNSLSDDVTPSKRSARKNDTAVFVQQPAEEKPHDSSSENRIMLEILEDIVKTVNSGGDTDGSGSGDPHANEYYMLPSRTGAKILGSVRVVRRTDANGLKIKGLVAQFSVGYLTSVPTPLQQEDLHYFFQIPPHNPLQLKHQSMEVMLNRAKARSDDESGRGFRMEMEFPLATTPLPVLAELLNYLLTNTNLYLP